MKPYQNTIGKYKAGETVFSKTARNTSLVVRRYIDMIFYCLFQSDPDPHEIALFERE
ncbi:MAG: hypothetical protein ACI9DM_000196, partial [Cyclobacteriaceae bacterium]